MLIFLLGIISREGASFFDGEGGRSFTCVGELHLYVRGQGKLMAEGICFDGWGRGEDVEKNHAVVGVSPTKGNPDL